MFKWIYFLMACLLCLGCQPSLLDKQSLHAFSEQFYLANERSNVEAMLALYELGYNETATISYIRTAIEFEIGLPIKTIYFEPLSGSPEEHIAYEHQGITYRSSLEPKYRMIVHYSNTAALVSNFTIGKNAKNQWRIITAAPSRTE